MLELAVLSSGRKRGGFTLLEALTGLAVAAILVTSAVPGMARLLRESRADTTINELIHAMRLARSGAVIRKSPVVVCAGDGAECTGGGDWERGWMVFTDPDGDRDCRDGGDRDCDGGGRVLHRVRNVDAGLDLSATGNPSRYGFLVYDPDGFAMGYATTFTLCHEAGGIEPRGFTLNMNGRIEPKEPGELDCS